MSQGESVAALIGARARCMLVVGGKYHDMEYARRELLAALGTDDRVTTQCFVDYDRYDLLQQSDFLVSYTCDVAPSLEGQRALRDFVTRGGRWLALHGTNSLLDFRADGKVTAPRVAPLFMEILGTTFVAHPPIEPYLVEVVRGDDPLVEGITPFLVTDELYLMEWHAELDVLLDTAFVGRADGFAENEWPAARHPVLYRRRLGAGEVLYFTLGHCRGHYDMRPLVDFWPQIDRGSWEFPEYRTILARAIAWAAGLPVR